MIAPTIRPAIEDDRDQLVRIMLDAFKASYATFMPREYVESWHKDNTARATVDKGLDRTGVAEIDGRVQGFATTEDDVLDELWVSPAAQGSGVGKTLVEWAGKQLLASGHRTMRLHCYGDNKSALAFYDRLGFCLIETYPSEQVAGGPVPVCILIRPAQFPEE